MKVLLLLALLLQVYKLVDGTSLYCKFEGKWVLVARYETPLDAEGLWQFGVPAASRKRLGRPEKVVESGPYYTWLTRDREIDGYELDGASGFELSLMRHETEARYGRPFTDPVWKDYFRGRPWYHPDKAYTEARLSEVERRNLRVILDYQKKNGKQFR